MFVLVSFSPRLSEEILKQIANDFMIPGETSQVNYPLFL